MVLKNKAISILCFSFLLFLNTAFAKALSNGLYTYNPLEKIPYISKTKDTLRLSEYGALGTGKDETKQLQKALDASSGKVLHISKQKGKYYLTGQLIVPSNITIIVDSDVVFMGKNDLKQDFKKFEVMWRFEESENVVFDGQGATFKMNKSSFKSEFNHVFMINGAKNIVLKNIKTIDSGGDGFYIGSIRTSKSYPENIILDNCHATNSTRQGLSITSVKNLQVLNSSFNYSKGKLPEAGVDIEPFNSKGVLQSIKFENTEAIGNRMRGFMVNLMYLNENSDEVDIVFENCIAENNKEGFSNRGFKGVKGSVKISNSIAKNSRFAGITESSNRVNSVKKIYENCVIENSNTANVITKQYPVKAGIYIVANQELKENIGNSTFINCKIINDSNSEYGLYIDNGKIPFEGISVEGLKIESPRIKTKTYMKNINN